MQAMTNMNGRPGIELRGLEKSFKTPHGTVEAVRGVDISIRPGEIVALLGPNGAGKSTTIDMLLGLVQPDAGSVSLFGRTPAEAVLAGRIGAMLQTGMLIQEIRIRADDESAALEIDDDGRATAAPGHGGSGLDGLRERAQRVRGTLEAGARADGGYRLRVTVPLPGP
jgi:ABC-type branched-subunit amino acid transport system ATPase component